MHPYRTHNCGQLSAKNTGEIVKISGWLNNRRDHGGVIFLDIRDHYGVTQVVIEENAKINLKVEELSHLRLESVLTIEGTVARRTSSATNSTISTGEIEVIAGQIAIISESDMVPFAVNTDENVNEELRMRYRFLDLRRQKMHQNIILRSQVIQKIRELMLERSFNELQTPILTASSPEGARDFLVPSRVHPGKFYALPQAPQQFKQLFMASGFDRYFQIAPCFRDEDSRADRSPGEFYQLDIEMSFVTQEDVFAEIEPVIRGVFAHFAPSKVPSEAFARISYKDAMLKYGCDKPDMRNPIQNSDGTEVFAKSDFSIFAKAIAGGAVVRCIPASGSAKMPRSFFDDMITFAIENGAKGLAYIIFDENGEAKGPIAKFLSQEQLQNLCKIASLQPGDGVFFSCAKEKEANKIASLVRNRVGKLLNLTNEDIYKFCWVIDFPYFEFNEEDGKIDFSHNPFSMPQGGMDSLLNKNPLEILAYQYDIVCNGIELSSGAIRNHKPEIIYKAFEIVGYTKQQVDEKFGALALAFKYGAPPHGGIAPGVDRIVMLLAQTENIREVIAFPLTSKAEDLLMKAPSFVTEKQLKELHILVKSK